MDIEQKKAFEKYGHFNSTHEVYGVLIEEVAEFFQVVMERPQDDVFLRNEKADRMIEELKLYGKFRDSVWPPECAARVADG